MGNKPSIQCLHVFGCEAYAHVPNEKLPNLDKKGYEMYLHQLYHWCERYKLWDPMLGKVLYGKKFIFREVDPSPIVVQPKEDEKNLVVQLPPKMEKVEPQNEQEFSDGPNEEDGSKTSKEEEKSPLQILRCNEPPRYDNHSSIQVQKFFFVFTVCARV
jgi:hypothetical protein